MKASHRTRPFVLTRITLSIAFVIIILKLGCRNSDKQEVEENSTSWFDLPEAEKRPERFEPFLQQHPEDRDHRDAAIVWYSRGEEDDNQLKRHTFEMIKYHPDSTCIYFENSSLFYKEPEYRDEVIAALEKQIEHGQRYHTFYWNLANTCEQGALPLTFRNEDNRKRFLRYFELPDDTQLPTKLNEKLADKAIHYYRLAIKSATEDYKSLYTRGLMDLLVKLEKPRESVEIARDIIKRSSAIKKNAEFLYTYGWALKKTGDIKEAEKMLRQVRHVDKEGFGEGPGHATTDAEMFLGKIALERGDTKTAAKHLLASVEVQKCCHNTTKGISLVLAEQLLEAGEADAVVEFCQKTLHKFVPGQPETEALLNQALAIIASQSQPTPKNEQ